MGVIDRSSQDDIATRQRSTDRTWEQRSAEEQLADYPSRFEIRGSPQSLAWPPICANCGAASTRDLHVQKAFYRHGRGRHYPGFLGYRVVSFKLPLCESCAARHRETLPHRSWLHRYRWVVFNPAQIATVGCAVLLWMTLPAAAELSRGSTGVAAWGLPAIFAAGMLWTIGVTWWMSRPDRFEPRTEISRACDVSHDVSQFFERRRHIYGCRLTAFADAMERGNADRVWTGQDQKRMWRMSLVATVLFLGGLVGARLLLWYFEGK